MQLSERKLATFNRNPFQKKTGSRLSVFLEEEKTALQPLPVSVYELAFWKWPVVQFNYHITIEKMHYSVPYEYIKHEVDVRLTRQILEVFYPESAHLLSSPDSTDEKANTAPSWNTCRKTSKVPAMEWRAFYLLGRKGRTCIPRR